MIDFLVKTLVVFFVLAVVVPLAIGTFIDKNGLNKDGWDD